MIRTILLWVLVLFIIALVIFWFVGSGGWTATKRTAESLVNPINLFSGSASGTPLRLPWEPTSFAVRGPDISQYVKQADAYQAQMAPDTTTYEEQAPVPGSEASSFGNPSPYVGAVSITDNAATQRDPELEYVEIHASADNPNAIDITNWSLQSAVSGLRAYIPSGVSVFEQGVVNRTTLIELLPGQSAILTTGSSPVGVSFQENTCTGYLAQTQNFSPELAEDCPAPSSELPETADNLREYGGSCFDYVSSIPSCYFSTSVPTNLSAACQSFIESTFSYNGCVALNRNQSDFLLPTWRVYLGVQAGIWYDTHDIVRLLDDEGRTVDVLTY